jgi:GntR family transcriptional regulator, transcriptional repressor for pyruvate dehydrogenase complex
MEFEVVADNANGKSGASVRVLLGEQVANYIIEYIHKHQLIAGDPLPSEKEFCDELGVSRTAVREGLKRLQALGLLKSRPRTGMVVQNADLSGIFKMISYNLSSNRRRLEDLFDMRYIVESSMVDLVILHASSDDIAALQAVIGRMESGVDMSLTDWFELDREFHTLLYRSTRNNFIMSMSALLDVFYAETFRMTDERYHGAVPSDLSEKALEDHKPILEALINRDPDGMKRLIKIHLNKNSLAKRPPYTAG